MPIPTANAQDAFLRLTLQAQAAKGKNGFDAWIPVSEIVNHIPEWRERDNRPVPGAIFVTCVEVLAKQRLLEFDMDSKPEWNLQSTRVKLTPSGVFNALLLERVETPESIGPCPECTAPLFAASGGGVKCSKCTYWFCY